MILLVVVLFLLSNRARKFKSQDLTELNKKMVQKVQCQRDEVPTLPILDDLFNWSGNVILNKNCFVLSNGVKEEHENQGFTTKIVRKSTSSIKKSEADADDLDLTGSPLKASFTLDHDEDALEEELDVVSLVRKFQGPLFKPLTTRQARKIISDECQNDGQTTFAVCNNDSNTIFLGSSKLEGQSLTTFKVEDGGQVTMGSDKNLLKTIISEHVGAKEITARAIYNKTSPIGSDIVNDDETCSSLKLRFHWKKPLNLLETPPGHAKINMIAKISFLDDRLACFPMFKEIEFLKGLKDGLDNQGIRWMKRSEDEVDLVQELQKTLLKIKQNGSRAKVERFNNEPFNDSKEEIEAMTIVKRQDLDLTDHLWDVMKKVESLEELKTTWTVLFLTFKKDKFRPYINVRNGTKVAKIVNEILSSEDQDVKPFKINEMEALEMLLEIGLEKLMRDYTDNLLNHHLSSRDELDQLSKQTDDKILTLKRLHAIQCLLCLCQTFMSPNPECLRSIAQQFIQMILKNPGADLEKELVFDIHSTQVKDQINTLCPSIWQCHIKSSTLKTTCHLSVDPPTDLVEIKDELLGEKDDEEKEEFKSKVNYYFLKATAVTHKGF